MIIGHHHGGVCVIMGEAIRKTSFIEEARRKQIIDTTIQAVARQGFGNTTLADIARAAGVSTGVITYHFHGKDDLIEQCIRALFEAPNAFVAARVESAEDPPEKVRAYIRSTIQFMRENREHTAALTYAFSHFNGREPRHAFSAKQHARIRKYVAKMLDEGQRAGAFRPFSSAVAAQLIIASLEGLMLQWVTDPAADLERCGEELIEMVEGYVLAD